MGNQPAARAGDATACAVPGHGSSTVVAGSANVFFDGLPAARQGDACGCGETITTGVSSTVFINGRPAALQGSTGSHGGVIIGGSGSVIIGDTFTPAPVTPVDWPVSGACSGRFQLIDQQTGEPVAGRRVRLWTADGWQGWINTDAQGMTSWVFHPGPQTLCIDLLPGGDE